MRRGLLWVSYLVNSCNYHLDNPQDHENNDQGKENVKCNHCRFFLHFETNRIDYKISSDRTIE